MTRWITTAYQSIRSLTYFQSSTSPSTQESQRFQVIRYAYNQLKYNAASIISDINGIHFGLLSLIIQPKTYETLTGSPYIKHTNPGTHTSYWKVISMETAAEILIQHKVNQGSFHTMHNTDLVLTKKITSDFWRPLSQRYQNNACKNT